VLSPCTWPTGKAWAYSITFDEALADLSLFAEPILEAFGVPGHVEVVASQIGGVRNIAGSDYNGMRHKDAAELRALLQKGWGVGNHSWSHSQVNLANAERELRHARDVLEDAVGASVSVYCAPGSNVNAPTEVIEYCRELGYTAVMGLTDAVNDSAPADPIWLNRTFLLSRA